MSSLLLAGVRVIDITRLLPGAYATLLMADLGADVIKIEDPRGGDPMRTLPSGGGTHAYFELLNRNKRSVTLDLRADAASAVLDAVLRGADVVVQSFRPATATRLGVDAASIRRTHPRIVHASVNGFGEDGPWANLPAHDVNFQALAGLLAADAPEAPRMLVADIGAAVHAMAGIVAALYHRERTGEGTAIEISLQDAALAWLLVPAARLLANDRATESTELPVFGTHACYNVYRTADGRAIAVGALEPKFWTTFCDRIGRPDLAKRQYEPVRAQRRTIEDVAAIVARRTQDEWLAAFSGVDACVTAVRTADEAIADPLFHQRGVVVRDADRTYVTSPVRTAGQPASDIRPAPALGADTDAILSEAGIGDADRTRLRSAGVI